MGISRKRAVERAKRKELEKTLKWVVAPPVIASVLLFGGGKKKRKRKKKLF